MLSLRVLVLLVMSTISLLFIILVLSALAQPIEEVGVHGACTSMSMMQRVTAWLRGVDMSSASIPSLTAQCPPRVIRLSQRASEETARRVLANELVRCWRVHGEGRVNYAPNTPSSLAFCMPCAYITLERDVHGLTVFLASTRVPGSRQTYLETIGGVDTAKQRVEGEDLLPRGSYVLLYYQYVEGEPWRIVTSQDVPDFLYRVTVEESTLGRRALNIVSTLFRGSTRLMRIARVTSGSFVMLAIIAVQGYAEYKAHTTQTPVRVSTLLLIPTRMLEENACPGLTQLVTKNEEREG